MYQEIPYIYMFFITDTDDVDVVVCIHSQRHQPPLLPFHFICVWNFNLLSLTNIVYWWSFTTTNHLYNQNIRFIIIIWSVYLSGSGLWY